MYAGALGDNAVERYAMFLTSLELSADVVERRLALTRARDHGLDMERVAVATAERTIEKAFSVSNSLQLGCCLSPSRSLSNDSCFLHPKDLCLRYPIHMRKLQMQNYCSYGQSSGRHF